MTPDPHAGPAPQDWGSTVSTVWDEMILAFADPKSAGDVKGKINRLAVADVGATATQWIAKHYCGYYTTAERKDLDVDIWYEWSFTFGRSMTFVVGLKYNWNDYGNDKGALADFTGTSNTIVRSLQPVGNNVINATSLNAAADTLDAMGKWLTTWEQQFVTWSGDVGEGDSDLQGEAAGLMKATLVSAARAVAETGKYLDGGQVAKTLRDTGTTLTKEFKNLLGVWDGWWGDPRAMPMWHLFSKFPAPASTPVTIEGTDTLDSISAKFRDLFKATGSPADESFWFNFERAAKISWWDDVKTRLDQPAHVPVVNIANSYVAAARHLHTVDPDFAFRFTQDDANKFLTAGTGGPGPGPGAGPPPPGSGGSGGEKGGEKGGGAGGGDLGLGGGGGQHQTVKPPPVPKSLSSGPKGGTSSKTKDLLGGGSQGGNNGQNTGGSFGQAVLGPDGKPLRDEKGMPILIPPGAVIDPRTGAVTGANGKPVLGKGKKPLILPKGSRIQPPAAISTGAGARDPNAELRRIRESLNTDSRLIRSANKSGEELWGPPRRATVSTASSGELGVAKTGGAGLRRMLDSNGNPVNQSVMSSGMSSRVRAALGESAAEAALADRAKQVAAAESRALGRGASGSGMPYMPPMGGMGGGGGGAPGGAGAGRTPNVWLSEEEEVWGTEPDSAPGVIGR
ncbi:hypothetical protein ACFWBX_08705 [Streptomyces sp. NPDC059991]|uniref:hypothetical protein n=1 Tax=Streptomyces sp. NPDC059991 TaxID=3347028 RepID=UPI003692C3AF